MDILLFFFIKDGLCFMFYRKEGPWELFCNGAWGREFKISLKLDQRDKVNGYKGKNMEVQKTHGKLCRTRAG